MRDLTKRAARLDRKLKRVDAEIAAAVKLAGELARDLEAQFAALEARVAQLRPLASALVRRPPAARPAPPPAESPGEIVDRYAAARLELSSGHVVQAAKLYSDFADWCRAAGVPIASNHTFGRFMRERQGIYKKKSNTVKYIGVRIRPDQSNNGGAGDDAGLLL